MKTTSKPPGLLLPMSIGAIIGTSIGIMLGAYPVLSLLIIAIYYFTRAAAGAGLAGTIIALWLSWVGV